MSHAQENLPGNLRSAIAAVPAGSWGVGVSGGADSVALLLLLEGRADLRIEALHLDHELRGQESADDARFVEALCARLGIACTIARRSDVEAGMCGLANPSAHLRAVRFEFFRRVCQEKGLAGVILAHHANDQAETIFQRLLKGSAPAGLMGMQPDSTISGLRIFRPLLGSPSADLRAWLGSQDQPWREDSSNRSAGYQRNRVRMLLRSHPELSAALRAMGQAMRALVKWARHSAPALEASFQIRRLAELPEPLAVESARRWLAQRNAPVDQLTPAVLARLIEMARDVATPSRRDFPGGLTVVRRGGLISIASSTRST